MIARYYCSDLGHWRFTKKKNWNAIPLADREIFLPKIHPPYDLNYEFEM